MTNHSRDNIMSRWPAKEIAEMEAKDQSAEREALPPLPAMISAYNRLHGAGDMVQLYSSDQMREYARAALSAREAPAPGTAQKVALDIAKWAVQGDKPDEWKLKEWAESLDRDAIGNAYDWLGCFPHAPTTERSEK